MIAATGPRERAGPLVLFDADCGFCTALVRRMQGSLFSARVTAVAYQQADLPAFGLTEAECAEQLHVVDGAAVFRGGAALARILRAARPPWPLTGRALTLPGVRAAFQGLYALLARNRHRLPGGSAACEMPSPGDRPGPRGVGA